MYGPLAHAVGTHDGRYSLAGSPAAVVRVITDPGGDLLLTAETAAGKELTVDPDTSPSPLFAASRFLSGRFVRVPNTDTPQFERKLTGRYSVRLAPGAGLRIDATWLAFPDGALGLRGIRETLELRRLPELSVPSVAQDLAGRWRAQTDTHYGSVFDIYASNRDLIVHRTAAGGLVWSNPDRFRAGTGQEYTSPLGLRLVAVDAARLQLVAGPARIDYTRDPETPGIAGAHQRIGAARRNGQGDTPLHLAARSGDVDQVRQILTTPGVDPAALDMAGNTPLHVAVLHARRNVIDTLIEHNRALVAVTDAGGRNAMALAASRGDVDSLRGMILIGEYLDATLRQVIETGDLESLRAFSGAGLPDELLVHNAVVLRKPNVVEELLTANPDLVTLPLFQASLADVATAEVVAGYLPPSGFDAAAGLRAAQAAKQYVVLPGLLAAGADPAACLAMAMQSGSGPVVAGVLAAGATAEPRHLSLAVASARAPVVEALLASGLRADSVGPEGWPMIVMAGNRGDAATVSALIAGGADIEAPNSLGLRALHLAVQRQDPGAAAVVQALVDAGVDVNAPNHLGASPLSTTQNVQIRQILQAAGAR